MSVSRQQLHDLVDIVDASEYDLAYRLLTKLVEEDVATPDEIEAIREGRKDFEQGRTVKHEDINWD